MTWLDWLLLYLLVGFMIGWASTLNKAAMATRPIWQLELFSILLYPVAIAIAVAIKIREIRGQIPREFRKGYWEDEKAKGFPGAVVSAMMSLRCLHRCKGSTLSIAAARIELLSNRNDTSMIFIVLKDVFSHEEPGSVSEPDLRTAATWIRAHLECAGFFA